MRIQIINYEREQTNDNVVYSKLSAPISLDEFDINVIDLSNEKIWYSEKSTVTVDCICDLKSVQQMVTNSKTSTIVYVLPQNIEFNFNHHGEFNTSIGRSIMVYSKKRLKDCLIELQKNILPNVISLQGRSMPELFFERTKTSINETEYEADFYINPVIATVLSTSVGSKKITTINLYDRIYITTLNVTSSHEKMLAFVRDLFYPTKLQDKPDWVDEIIFFDDERQTQIIEDNKVRIHDAETRIREAKKRLDDNSRIKSILYTNGSELVDVVFEIIGNMFDYDLTGFIDEKKEDFCIQKDNYTLIGEIKGITSNVKSENVSQLDVHYQHYQDKLAEEGRTENVYQVLVINPLRKKPLSEREPVHDIQIDLAKRNGSLIIETSTLLRMYEKFMNGELTIEDCEHLILHNVGLLREEDLLKTSKK